MIAIVVAKSINNVIGINNQIPWHLSEDLKRFKKITEGGTVIMGRKTFESIGKPLSNRLNIIVSRKLIQSEIKDDIIIAKSLNRAIPKAPIDKNIFIIGGGEIYKEAISNNLVDYIYVTDVLQNFEGDTFFPNIESYKFEIEKTSEVMTCPKTGIQYQYKDYKKLIPV